MKLNHPVNVEELEGAYTAVITPMLKGDGLKNLIDYTKLYHLILDQVKAGINGIVVAGTTGQSATLSHQEHADFVTKVYEHVSERHPTLQFIVGAGSNCTREAISLSKEIESRIGPSTFLHVTGYYNNPPQEGIFAHFKRLAREVSESNIILYNVPSRTNSRIDATTLFRLIEGVDNIIGIKEASGDMGLIKAVTEFTNHKRFRVLSGEDHLVARIIRAGGRGVISASANIAPKYFVKITKHALAENFDMAERLQQGIWPLVEEGVFYRKNPIPLAEMFNTELRLPNIAPHLKEVLARYTPEGLGINLADYIKG